MESMPKCVVEKEFERKRAYDIIQKLEESDYSLDVCEWACRAFVSVAGLAMQTHNAESMADFLDDEGCEALINIMHKYSTISSTIAYQGCLTVSILSWSLRDLKEFLGEIGACETVVFAMSMNFGDPKVSEFGSAAVGLLAKNNNSNSFRLAEAGACDVIAQVGNFGFNLRNESCIEVATNVCLAFAQMSEAVNAQRLMECGASALVVELLKLHKKNASFAAAAIKAVCGLSSLNAKHREELGRVGACECILEVMRTHRVVSITQECVEAMMHLTLSPTNTALFGNAGASSEVVLALRTMLMENDFGAEVCSGAMLNLATYGVQATENRIRLVDAGAVEQLRLAQMSTKASYRAREQILKLLSMLVNDQDTPSSSSSQLNGSTSSSGSINGSGSGATRSNSQSHKSLRKVVSVIHGSEMKGDTVPLHVEITEVYSPDRSYLIQSAHLASMKLSSDRDDADDDLLRNPSVSSNGVYEI